jgi:hypothetical protein
MDWHDCRPQDSPSQKCVPDHSHNGGGTPPLSLWRQKSGKIMSATLQESVTNLVDQVARLAQRIDRLVATRETNKQRTLLPYASTTQTKSDRRKFQARPTSKGCPLVPLDEETLANKSAMSAENTVAASVADLYERLGGFIEGTVDSKRRSDI